MGRGRRDADTNAGDVAWTRMMNVDVPCPAPRRARPVRPAGGGPEPVVPGVRRPLAAQGIRHGEPTGVETFVTRRRVALLTFTDGPPLLLTWLDGEPARATDDGRFALGLLAAPPLAGPTRRAVPRLVAYDEDQRVLVLDGVRRGVTLAGLLPRSPS